jgi:uncharacterized protein (DUF58 family)
MTDRKDSTRTPPPVGVGPSRRTAKSSKRLFRITRQGWYFLVLTVGVGLAALRTGNNLLYLVLGMMLGMILLSGILAELSLRRLELERYPPSRMRSCKPFLMHVAIRNGKKMLPSFSIEVEDILEGQLMDKRCYFLKIPAGRRQRTSYRHAFPRRGSYRFVGFKVSTKFPFGFLRKSVILKEPGEVIVYPSPKKANIPPAAASAAQGARFRRLPQRVGDPYGLREYRPGDDLRLVHQKASAHLNRLVVREHEDSLARRAVIYLDNELRLEGQEAYLSSAEALERAIGQAAFVASRLADQGIETSLVTRTGVVPFGRGRSHLAAIMRLLALLDYSDRSKPLVLRHHAPADVALLVDRDGVRPLEAGGAALRPATDGLRAEPMRATGGSSPTSDTDGSGGQRR